MSYYVRKMILKKILREGVCNERMIGAEKVTNEINITYVSSSPSVPTLFRLSNFHITGENFIKYHHHQHHYCYRQRPSRIHIYTLQIRQCDTHG